MRILWWFAPWTAWSTWVCHKKLKGSEMEDGKGPTCHFSVVLGRRRVPADSPIEVERANWGIHRWKSWCQHGGNLRDLFLEYQHTTHIWFYVIYIHCIWIVYDLGTLSISSHPWVSGPILSDTPKRTLSSNLQKRLFWVLMRSMNLIEKTL